MNTTATTRHVSFRSLFSSRLVAALCLSVGVVVCLAGLTPTSVQAQNTYTVNSTGDAGDANLGDGVCDDGNGNCTLRAAIEEANQSTDQDLIEFGDIAPGAGPAQITPGSQLRVSEIVTIDGSSEDSYTGNAPTVLIDGNSLPNNTDGLYLELSANGSTIEALAVVDAPSDGIDVGSEVTIRDCYIGVSTDGTTANGNGNAGIRLFGDENFAFDNVVGGNANSGVLVQGNTNYIYNNRIGVGADGTTDVGNGAAGVRVENANNFIGACLFGCAGNIISGNDGAGIQINANGQTVVTNRIGTNESGTSSIPNNNGIAVESSNNTIGGSDDQRNVISGNDFNGIRIGVGNQTSADNNTIENNYIGTDAGGTSAIPNGNGCVEGGVRIDEGSDNTITSNVIAGNAAHGVFIRGSSFRNDVTNNYVGTNSSAADLGNDCDGVQINSSPSSVANENEVHAGNVIGNNTLHGVDMNGGFGKVTNNHIGTDANGNDLGNGADGVNVSGDVVLVGKSTGLGEGGNIIGHNASNGIHINTGSTTNVIANYIGTNASGDNLGNGQDGILIEASSGTSASSNVIGYTYSNSFTDPLPSNGGDGNVIANNAGDGVDLKGAGTVIDNSIRGNKIFSNAEIGIDLAGGNEDSDGKTNNDDGDDDDDTGPNNLQNFPVINDVTYDSQNDEVTIDYTVFTGSNHADYGQNGLKIDFYADIDSDPEARTYLDTQFYNAPSSSKQVVIALPSGVTSDDRFVATATDADGNTSELFHQAQLLPVELARFDAQADGETVQLSWKTASETNNAGFNIQRKRSGEEQWTKVGFVEGHGTTSEPKTYSFDDKGIPFEADSLSYRLKQVDLDGAFEYSEAVEVAIAAPEELALHGNYPNPFAGQTTIRYEVPQSGDVRLAVYNVLGQQVALIANEQQEAGRKEMTFTARDLSSGVYFVRLTHDGTTRTQKITVVR